MKNILQRIIRQCEDSFLEEHKLDAVDINILDNYTDYIVETLDILLDRMREK